MATLRDDLLLLSRLVQLDRARLAEVAGHELVLAVIRRGVDELRKIRRADIRLVEPIS